MRWRMIPNTGDCYLSGAGLRYRDPASVIFTLKSIEMNEQTVADAILDRIVYDAHRIELLGESMRRTLKNKITEMSK
jgi:DNA replication protein DnaC